MDFTSKNKTAKNFTKELSKGKYNIHHRLQRKEGMWNAKQKSLLIDSILRSYPIDPIRCEKDNETFRIFDGVQRSTTLKRFLADEFKLSKDLNPVILDGVEYEIAGKSFSNLDTAVKDKIESFELIIYTFTDCTDEDIRNMFLRQNNGKALSNTQKRTAIEPQNVSDIVFELASNEMFEKFLTEKQINSDVSRDIIRETLMIINSSEEHDFINFSAKAIDDFVLWYSESVNNDDVEIIKQAMSEINEAFEEKIKLAHTSLPMVLYAAYEVKKSEKDFAKFIEALKIFIEEYDENDLYRSYLAGGTTKPQSINGRLNYWRGVIENL